MLAPLSEALRFLAARSGAALAEFLVWSVRVKGPAWTVAVAKELPMTAETADHYIYVPDDPEEQYRIKTRDTKRLLDAYPDAANDILQHAREESRLDALRHSVLAVLAARGLSLSDAARARIEATTYTAQLDAWHLAAITATSADDALR